MPQALKSVGMLQYDNSCSDKAVARAATIQVRLQ